MTAAAAPTPPESRQVADPVCPTCSSPIVTGSLVLFQRGELFHVRCISLMLGLTESEGRDRAAETRRRAAQAIKRAAGLIDAAKSWQAHETSDEFKPGAGPGSP